MNEHKTHVDAISWCAVEGADSADFLHRMLTHSMINLKWPHYCRAALCSVQGRVIATLLVVRVTEERFLLSMPESIVETVINTLKHYQMRSRLTLSDISLRFVQRCYLMAESTFSMTPLAAATKEAKVLLDDHGTVTIRLESCDGVVAILRLLPEGGRDENVLSDVCSKQDWRSHFIRCGIPDLPLAASEKFTAHMLNLDVLDMIDFKKGCYPGQEVIARTQYRGQSKRRTVRITGHVYAEPLTDIKNTKQERIGTVYDCIFNAQAMEGLAVINVNADHKQLLINGVGIHVAPLPYSL